MFWRSASLRNATLLGLSLLMSAALAEATLRLVRPQFTYSRLIELAGTYYADSDYNTFQLKANYRGREPSMEYSGRYATITTNSDRFRGTGELDPKRQKILVLGDSFTFGVYVDDNETYPAVLESLVHKASDRYQVINAGYTDGFETDQEYVWLRHNIASLQPRIVVLGVFLANDITGIAPALWAELDRDGLPTKWIDPDISVTATGFLQSRKEDASTVGIEAIYKVPVLRESHLAILAAKAWDRIENLISPRRPEPIGEMFDHVFGQYSEQFLGKEAIFLKLLTSMKALCRENGSDFAIALLPMSVMVDKEKFDMSATFGTQALPARFRGSESVYYARLMKLLREIDIPAIDIEREMKLNAPLGPFFPANGEVHFNPRGHQFTAERIFAFLQASGKMN